MTKEEFVRALTPLLEDYYDEANEHSEVDAPKDVSPPREAKSILSRLTGLRLVRDVGLYLQNV